MGQARDWRASNPNGNGALFVWCGKCHRWNNGGNSASGPKRPHTSGYHNLFSQTLHANMNKKDTIQKSIIAYRVDEEARKKLKSIFCSRRQDSDANRSHRCRAGKYSKPSGLKDIASLGKIPPPPPKTTIADIPPPPKATIADMLGGTLEHPTTKLDLVQLKGKDVTFHDALTKVEYRWLGHRLDAEVREPNRSQSLFPSLCERQCKEIQIEIHGECIQSCYFQEQHPSDIRSIRRGV